MGFDVLKFKFKGLQDKNVILKLKQFKIATSQTNPRRLATSDAISYEFLTSIG